MKKIIYPTIDVFIYQLAEGLGDDPDREGKANISAFVNLFPSSEMQKKIRDAIAHQKSSAAKSGGFRQLISNPNFFPLTYGHIKKNPNLDVEKNYSPKNLEDIEDRTYTVQGFYYPAISADTLGLLFDCSVDRYDLAQPLDCFQRLKTLVPKTDSALGKSWILSGYSQPDNQSADLAEMAKAIYQEFRKSDDIQDAEQTIQWEWGQHLHGKFLGHDIFWTPPNSMLDSGSNDRGVLIVIYASETIPDAIVQSVVSDLNRDWMNLFWFQNKIIWAYQQSQELKQELNREFIEIRQTFLEIKKLSVETNSREIDIKNLQLILKKRAKTLSSYAINLCYLEIQISTIETNLHNYELCLNHIETQSQKWGKTSLSCFRDFIDVVKNQYKKQVEKDYTSLKPGLTALENLINPIKSIVDLEQGERDRNLEKNIAIFGFGIGAAGGVASASASYAGAIQEIWPIQHYVKFWQLNNQQSNLVITLNFSLFAGALASLITAGVIKVFKQSRHNPG